MSKPIQADLPSGNLLADLPAGAGAEAFQTLFEASGLRIERIVTHDRANSDGFWYDQPQDEWVMVTTGEAVLEFDDGSRRSLRPGDWVVLRAHIRHRVAATFGRTVWLAVHFPQDSR